MIRFPEIQPRLLHTDHTRATTDAAAVRDSSGRENSKLPWKKPENENARSRI